jgi:MFS family permease
MLRWIDTLFPRRALFQRDRRILHLFLGRVLAGTGFAIVIPFLGLYLHSDRGVPMSAVGGLFFLSALAGAGGQLLGGELTDRFGRKGVMVASQLGRGVTFVGLGAAALAHASVLWFAILTAVSAFAGRMFEPPSGAMVADITSGEARSESYAVLRIGGNLGWALGPAVGGFLAALSYPLLFLAAAALLFTSASFIAWRVEETRPSRDARRVEPEAIRTGRAVAPVAPPAGPAPGFGFAELRLALRDGIFMRYCLVSLLLFTVMGQLISTVSVYTVEWAGISKVELGTLYALNGFMVVFLQFPVVRALARYRMTTALIAGSVLYAVGYAMMGLGKSLPLFFAAMFVVTAGEIVTSPASLNLVASLSTEEMRGRYMGVFGLFNSFGWSIGPLVGGILLDIAARRSMLVWGPIACLTLLAAVGYADLRRRIDRRLDDNRPSTGEETRATIPEARHAQPRRTS